MIQTLDLIPEKKEENVYPSLQFFKNKGPENYY